jgi:hypothetical protein
LKWQALSQGFDQENVCSGGKPQEQTGLLRDELFVEYSPVLKAVFKIHDLSFSTDNHSLFYVNYRGKKIGKMESRHKENWFQLIHFSFPHFLYTENTKERTHTRGHRKKLSWKADGVL